MGQQMKLMACPWTRMVEGEPCCLLAPLAGCVRSVFTYMYIHTDIKKSFKPGIVWHAFNPSTSEGEAEE